MRSEAGLQRQVSRTIDNGVVGWIPFAVYLAGSAPSPQVAVALSHADSGAVLYVGAAASSHRVDGIGFVSLSFPCEAAEKETTSLGFSSGIRDARVALDDRVRVLPDAPGVLAVYADARGAALFEGARCRDPDVYVGVDVAVVTQGLPKGSARRIAAELGAVQSEPVDRMIAFIRDSQLWWPGAGVRIARLLHRDPRHAPVDLQVRASRSLARALSWRHLAHLGRDEVVFQLRADDAGDPGALDRAEAAARRALDVWPKYGRLRARLALILSARAPEDSAALRQAELAIRYAPNDARVRRLVAEVYWRAGDIKRAKRHVVTASILDPDTRPVDDFGDLLRVLERS